MHLNFRYTLYLEKYLAVLCIIYKYMHNGIYKFEWLYDEGIKATAKCIMIISVILGNKHLYVVLYHL